MGIGYYNSLVTLQAAGPNLTASLTATSLLNPQGKVTLPAGFFSYIGQKLKINAQGQLGNIITTPGTLTIDVRFGSVVVFNGGAMQLRSAAHPTLPILVVTETTFRALRTASEPPAQLMRER